MARNPAAIMASEEQSRASRAMDAWAQVNDSESQNRWAPENLWDWSVTSMNVLISGIPQETHGAGRNIYVLDNMSIVHLMGN